MKNLLLRLIISTVAIFITGRILNGVHLESLTTAIITSIVLGTLNLFIKPIIEILALPINILTLGLFSLVINAVIVLLGAYLVPGFEITTFWSAMLFSIIVSFVNSFLVNLTK